MCKNCYSSDMGLARRKEDNESSLALKNLKFNGYNDPEYIKASLRCIDAGKAMQQLHSEVDLSMRTKDNEKS